MSRQPPLVAFFIALALLPDQHYQPSADFTNGMVNLRWAESEA